MTSGEEGSRYGLSTDVLHLKTKETKTLMEFGQHLLDFGLVGSHEDYRADGPQISDKTLL